MPDSHAAVTATLQRTHCLRREICAELRFVKSTRNAPKAVSNVAYELETFDDTSGQLEQLAEDPTRALFVVSLKGSLEKSKSILEDLRQILHTNTDSDGHGGWKWKRFAWTFKEKDVSLIQTRMQSCNQALELAISIGRIAQSTSESTDVKEVRVYLEKLQKTVEGRLWPNAEPQVPSSVAAGTDYGYALKQYLREDEAGQDRTQEGSPNRLGLDGKDGSDEAESNQIENSPESGAAWAGSSAPKCYRDIIRKENPGIKFGQVGKVLGERWKTLSERQRQPYKMMAAADKKRYEDEKASLSGLANLSLSPDKRARSAKKANQKLSSTDAGSEVAYSSIVPPPYGLEDVRTGLECSNSCFGRVEGGSCTICMRKEISMDHHYLESVDSYAPRASVHDPNSSDEDLPLDTSVVALRHRSSALILAGSRDDEGLSEPTVRDAGCDSLGIIPVHPSSLSADEETVPPEKQKISKRTLRLPLVEFTQDEDLDPPLEPLEDEWCFSPSSERKSGRTDHFSSAMIADALISHHTSWWPGSDWTDRPLLPGLYPHFEDIMNDTDPQVARDAPLDEQLSKAEEYIDASTNDMDSERPDIIYNDYMRGLKIAVIYIPQHQDSGFFRDNDHRWYMRYLTLYQNILNPSDGGREATLALWHIGQAFDKDNEIRGTHPEDQRAQPYTKQQGRSRRIDLGKSHEDGWVPTRRTNGISTRKISPPPAPVSEPLLDIPAEPCDGQWPVPSRMQKKSREKRRSPPALLPGSDSLEDDRTFGPRKTTKPTVKAEKNQTAILNREQVTAMKIQDPNRDKEKLTQRVIESIQDDPRATSRGTRQVLEELLTTADAPLSTKT